MDFKLINSWKSVASLVAVGLLFIVACGNNQASHTGEEESADVVNAVSENSALLSGEEATALAPSDAEINLRGTVSNKPNELVLLHELTPSKLIFLDSTRTDSKGRFGFAAGYEKDKLCLINIGSTKSPGIPVVMGKDRELKIDVDANEFFPVTKVKGDKYNQHMKTLYDIYMGHNKMSNDFNERVSRIDPAQASDSLKKAFNEEYTAMQKRMMDEISAFIEGNEGSPATYFAATYIMQSPPVELLEKAVDRMKSDMPESHFTSELDSRLNAIKPLDIGGMAPEISLKSPEGEIVSLSSLRGKVVLIDFWASWCGPCRRENPNVVRVYKKYNEKGFEIYGVSLDNNASKWQAAIRQDGLEWIHVSDLRGWNSVAAQTYKVHSIPSTVLLDANGRILAKDLRGAQLEAKLAEIFN